MSDYFCFDRNQLLLGKTQHGHNALTSLILLTLFGCLTADEALAYFGDSNVVMIGACA